jgi:alpha-D-xyloside xylohydrolase
MRFPFSDVVNYSLKTTVEPDLKKEELRRLMLSNTQDCSCDFKYTEEEDCVTLDTGVIKAKVWKDPFYFVILDSEGNEFFSNALADTNVKKMLVPLQPRLQSSRKSGEIIAVYDTIKIAPDEGFFGFGEIFSPINKRGSKIDCLATDAVGVHFNNRAYKNIPFFISTQGYGMFVYSTARIEFDMAATSQRSYTIKIHDDEYSAYVIYGPAYKDILKRYCDITGYAFMPPKYSFGLWMSRCLYKNREELEEVATKLREHEIPCDVLHIDPYWMGDEGTWCNMQWNEQYFPKPKEMFDKLDGMGYKICLWENSYVPTNTEMYDEGAEKGYFVKDKDGNVYLDRHWCSGTMVKEEYKMAYVDFTNPSAVEWYKQKHRDILDHLKVASFKTDFGEFAPSDGVYYSGVEGSLVHNIYPLMYNKTVYEVLQEYYGDDALIWGRSAYAGSQRYPVYWGGDPWAYYSDMASQLRGILSMGMSGLPFASHDISGFNGLASESIYVRWAQFGMFSSHSRCHGTFPKEPWEYGEEAERCFREAVNLRYRLLPYIYSEAYTSTQTGLPMVRPMLLEYQDDRLMRDADLQYMFGGSFLMAPIFNEEGCASVVLPRDRWFDFWTDRINVGPEQLDEVYELDKFPLFVREGSIIPMLRERVQYIGDKAWDKVDIHIYDGKAGQYSMYDKLNGNIVKTDISFIRNQDSVDINISGNRTDTVVLYHGMGFSDQVLVDGAKAVKVETIEEVYSSRTPSWTMISNTVVVNVGEKPTLFLKIYRS